MVRCGAEDLRVTRDEGCLSDDKFGLFGGGGGKQEEGLTGKTSGMPPLTALEPSSTAFSLSQSFSFPAASFQLITVAPCSRTSTDSPVGSWAETRPVSLSMSTEAWASGCCGVDASADGLLGRSTMIAFSSSSFLLLRFLFLCLVFRGRQFFLVAAGDRRVREVKRGWWVKSYLFWLCVSVAQLDPLSLVVPSSSSILAGWRAGSLEDVMAG